VWFEQSTHYPSYQALLWSLKTEIFGDDAGKITLHRKEMIHRSGRFSVLGRDGLGEKLDGGWLNVIGAAKYRCACVVIDKQLHQRKYTNPFHPYHLALASILDRYCGWLRTKLSMGDVMAESRNPSENRALQTAYRIIISRGTLQFPAGWHRPVLTSGEIKFREKQHHIAGLELTDSLAFPLRQWALIGKQRIDDPGEVFGKRVVRQCAPRLHRQPSTGRISGYGMVWLPKDEGGSEIIWPVQ
jgi:hypothetical protein